MVAKKSKKKSTFSQIRPYIQGFFLLFFLYLFFKVTYPLQKDLTQNFFFNLDPLIALVMILTGTVLLAGLILSVLSIIVTVLFGRIFCGWICPMGTIFDLFASIIPVRKNGLPFGHGTYKNIKYYLLAFLLISSIAGFSAFMFFDPLVFLFRVFTLNLYPFVLLLSNLGLDAVRPIAMNMGAYELSSLSYEQPVFVLGIVNLILFLTVAGFIYVERRFWCRNLCPLGATLSLLSRYSIRGRNVSETCINCSKCAKECPMNAIDNDYSKTSLRECIQCNHCADACPVDAISYPMKHYEKQRFEFNPSRRSILYSGVGGLLTGLAAGSSASTKTTNDKLLRPPGALIESDFLDACLRCGECMKACPTNGLQPAVLHSGFEGMFTPVLVPRIGGCEENCNLCGQVCPTGAIRNLPIEDKQYAAIGNAIIERPRCIAWEQCKLCLICDEVCPYDAIEFRMVTDEKGTLQRPFVLEDKCVGCGQCENGCPVNGPAAIHVTPINEVRKNSGTYMTDAVKRLRETEDEDQDYYRGYEEQGDIGGESTQDMQTPVEDDEGLPPGFLQ